MPRAVREAGERADALLQAMNTATQAAQRPPETPQAPVTPPVETPAIVPSPAPVVVETPPQPAPADPWELRYKVLDGKYKAEVPRFARDNAELRRENDELRAQLQTRSTTPAPPAIAPGVQSVTDQYGEDFAAAVAAVAQAQVAPLREEFTARASQAEERAAQSSRQAFLVELARLVPSFEAIDAEPGFTTYLDEFDAMTGRTRREFFQEADAANNAPRIATFFDNYTRSKIPAQQPAAAPAAPSVEHLIQPDSQATSEAPPGRKLWKRAEIARFYDDVRRGVYSHADYLRIDADISIAPQEGRVIG